jgi:transcriptional regulator with AAA-type ATPase domain
VCAEGPIVIDLGTGEGEALIATTRTGHPTVRLTAQPNAGPASASVVAMMARDVTHVIAMPLRRTLEEPVSQWGGMVCVELAWPAGIGAPWPEGAWRSEVSIFADVASTALLSLPIEASLAQGVYTGDPLFPIAGMKMRQLLRVLAQFAPQEETLSIAGPTGAGKSRLAEWCHARSHRHNKPFVVASLLALPESTQLAELFGWKRGAFTGALSDHDGLVAQAEGGTLFVDEIDKLSLAAQAGLLRLLETRQFSPLGAPRERKANVRFITATNGDLRALVGSGAFREDLYYRINVLPVTLPSLAERAEEVVPWAHTLLALRSTTHPVTLTQRASKHLENARWPATPWPGNLRQLDNVMRRAFALAHRSEGSIIVDEEHVESALSPELIGRSEPIEQGLRSLAHRIASHAIELEAQGQTLPLDVLDGLRGAVLRAAVEQVGSVKAAFTLLGADALVQSRNHQATYRKELAFTETLEKALSRTKRS